MNCKPRSIYIQFIIYKNKKKNIITEPFIIIFIQKQLSYAKIKIKIKLKKNTSISRGFLNIINHEAIEPTQNEVCDNCAENIID